MPLGVNALDYLRKGNKIIIIIMDAATYWEVLCTLFERKC